MACIVSVAVLGPVGAGCQSGPLGFGADPKSAEWALVLKEGKLSSFSGLHSYLCFLFSFLFYVSEVSVNVDKGVRNVLPAWMGWNWVLWKGIASL